VLDCEDVGATRRSLAIACALAVVIVPAAAGAKSDLTVSVSRLSVPATIQSGKTVKFSVLYVVRGPTTQSAQATVVLKLIGTDHYSVTSLPARVRPAIWRWNVQDTLPAVFSAGRYRAVATITLRRSGKTIAHTTSSTTVIVK
jgi:nitrogen fixation protein FixH